MTIDRIEFLPRGDHEIRILLSDGTIIKTQDYVAADLNLCPGQTLDEEKLSVLLDAAGIASAKARAIRILSATTVSSRELKERLVRKGEQEEHAQCAVEWLQELRLLDDQAAAEQAVRSAAAKGYGAARVKQILYEKRIPEEYWEDALALLPPMDDAIDRFLRQRFRGAAPEQKEIKRAVDALVRRGHSWQEIRAGLSRYGETVDWEEPYE